MFIPQVVLSLRGLQVLADLIEQGQAKLGSQGRRMVVAVLGLSLLAMANYIPWRSVDTHHVYLNMSHALQSLAQKHGFGRSIVLVRGESHPDYASAWIYNPLDPYTDQTIYAYDQNPEVLERVLKAYPDHPVWIIEGPSIAQGGYRVVEAPSSVNMPCPNP